MIAAGHAPSRAARHIIDNRSERESIFGELEMTEDQLFLEAVKVFDVAARAAFL